MRPSRSRVFPHSLAISLAFVALACANKADEGESAPKKATAAQAHATAVTAPIDAGAESIDATAIADDPIPVYDPATGYHLDDIVEYARPTRKAAASVKRQIQITLRSTPPGALASVDGAVIGRTPTLWTGEANAERQFTFVLPGYVMARYRFIATTDGTVHGRLTKMTKDSPDAGVPAAPPSAPAATP